MSLKLIASPVLSAFSIKKRSPTVTIEHASTNTDNEREAVDLKFPIFIIFLCSSKILNHILDP